MKVKKKLYNSEEDDFYTVKDEINKINKKIDIYINNFIYISINYKKEIYNIFCYYKSRKFSI